MDLFPTPNHVVSEEQRPHNDPQGIPSRLQFRRTQVHRSHRQGRGDVVLPIAHFRRMGQWPRQGYGLDRHHATQQEKQGRSAGGLRMQDGVDRKGHETISHQMQYYFYLRYLNILETVGFFIKKGIPCRIEPVTKEHANIFFDDPSHGEAARRSLPFLGTIPVKKR